MRNRDGKRPLGTPRRRWEDNIRVGVLKELCARAGAGLLLRDRDR